MPGGQKSDRSEGFKRGLPGSTRIDIWQASVYVVVLTLCWIAHSVVFS